MPYKERMNFCEVIQIFQKVASAVLMFSVYGLTEGYNKPNSDFYAGPRRSLGLQVPLPRTNIISYYRGAGKSLARSTSRCILFDG